MAVNKTGSRKKFEWGIKGETVEEIGISPEILPDSIMYKEINTDDGQQIMKKQPKSNFSSLKNYRNKKGAQSQVRVDQVNYGNYVFMGSTAIEPPHLRSQRTIGVETIESESNNCTNWQIMSLDVNGIGCSPNESSTYSNSLMSNNPFDEYSNPAADGFDDRDFFTNAAPTDWLIPVFQSPGSFNGLFFTR